MNRLPSSAFKRIHLGLLLDLLRLFLFPALLCIVLLFISIETAEAGLEPNTVSAETLMQNPTLSVRLLYSILTLQYCAAALTSLVVVSGISELESGSKVLQRSKRAYVALLLAEALAMLAHITSLILQSGDTGLFVSMIFLISIALILVFRCAGLRSLMLGFREILARIGDEPLSHEAGSLAQRITAVMGLLFSILLIALVLPRFQAAAAVLKRLLQICAVVLLVYFAVISFQIVRCARRAADEITALSE